MCRERTLLSLCACCLEKHGSQITVDIGSCFQPNIKLRLTLYYIGWRVEILNLSKWILITQLDKGESKKLTEIS